MSVSTDYFSKFNDVIDKYLPKHGEGNTKASQIVVAVNKLLYRWYNSGDVFDTSSKNEWSSHCCNDISDFANWLYEYTDLSNILDNVYWCDTEDDYEELLKKLADTALNEEYLIPYATQSKEGNIYECKGDFEYVIHWEDEEEEEEEDW